MVNENIPGAQVAEDTLLFLSSIILLLVAVILFFAVLILAHYLIKYYHHPDDNDQSWSSRITAVFSMALVIYMPVYASIDFVATGLAGCGQARSFEEDLVEFRVTCTAPFRVMLYVLLLLCILMTSFVIPFMLALRLDLLSKSLGQRVLRAFVQGTLQTSLILGVTAIIFVIQGPSFKVPVKLVASDLRPYGEVDLEGIQACLVSENFNGRPAGAFSDSDIQQIPQCRTGTFYKLDKSYKSQFGKTALASYVTLGRSFSSFLTYLVAVHVSMGWVVLSVLGGVGLAALPWLYIKSFIYRPRRPATRSEFLRHTLDIMRRAQDIKDKCLLAKEDEGKVRMAETLRVQREVLRDVVLLEKEDQHLNEVFPGNAFDPERHWAITVMGQYLSLLYGVIGAVVSACWIAQLAVFVLPNPPKSLFLNAIFALEADDPILNFISVVLMILFTFHLNYCCNQGLYSFTMTFSVLPVYPLTKRSTMIDSVLMNCLIGLYSAPAILVFQVSTIPLAARGSNIAYLFAYEVEYLSTWGVLLQSEVFFYLMLLCFSLTVVIGGLKELKKWVKHSKIFKKEEEEEYLSGLEEY